MQYFFATYYLQIKFNLFRKLILCMIEYGYEEVKGNQRNEEVDC